MKWASKCKTPITKHLNLHFVVRLTATLTRIHFTDLLTRHGVTRCKRVVDAYPRSVAVKCFLTLFIELLTVMAAKGTAMDGPKTGF